MHLDDVPSQVHRGKDRTNRVAVAAAVVVGVADIAVELARIRCRDFEAEDRRSYLDGKPHREAQASRPIQRRPILDGPSMDAGDLRGLERDDQGDCCHATHGRKVVAAVPADESEHQRTEEVELDCADVRYCTSSNRCCCRCHW